MSSSNNSTNSRSTDTEPDKIRGRYIQPLSPREREDRLQSIQFKLLTYCNRQDETEESEFDIQSCLQDDWKNSIFRNRTEVVRETIRNLGWLDDHNHRDWIRKKVLNSPLGQNWYGGVKEINMFIESTKFEKDGHYSVYQDDLENDEISVDFRSSWAQKSDFDTHSDSGTESTSSSQTEQNVGRNRKAKRPTAGRQGKCNDMLSNPDM